MLLLAATPIGNLADASARLIEVLGEAKYIAAEDTRTVLKLANALDIKLNAKLFSLHEHNEAQRLDQILDIAENETVLVVSDAGMPTISDPGFLLVRAAVAKQIAVSVIPGPSAVLSALAVSGLPTDRFSFEGFIPRKQGERNKFFSALIRESRTMIFFESPHRILESLKDAATVFGGDRLASVSRELTKKFEHTERGSLEQLCEWAKSEPKGEMVLVIAGAAEAAIDIEDLVEQVKALTEEGVGLKEAVAEVASAAGASKGELYQLVLDSRKAR
ncbi:MAG: 16S rRNA (cytidine(1402)-2'-O)-methyltransferase [Rhodoluna sp.]